MGLLQHCSSVQPVALAVDLFAPSRAAPFWYVVYLLIAVLVWLFGRAFRYILAGK
jgi:hypothetical protein